MTVETVSQSKNPGVYPQVTTNEAMRYIQSVFCNSRMFRYCLTEEEDEQYQALSAQWRHGWAAVFTNTQEKENFHNLLLKTVKWRGAGLTLEMEKVLNNDAARFGDAMNGEIDKKLREFHKAYVASTLDRLLGKVN